MKTANIQFINKTNFFAQKTSNAVNKSRMQIFDKVCAEIKKHLESGCDTTKASIANLANIYRDFNNIEFQEFMQLWMEEDNADIVYANQEFCEITHHYTYIIAFVGRCLSGLEVTIYEF